MGLLSFLKREPPPGATDRPAAKPLSPEEVQRVRTQARRRLIGAFVLLGIGIIAFPLVFETQPRPVAVDLPIDIPRKDTVAPLNLPPPRTPAARASGPVTAEAPREAASAPTPMPPQPSPAAAPSRTASAPAVAPSTETARTAAPAPARPAAPPPPATPAVAEATRAKALLDGKPDTPDDPAPAGGKFVVQVGAFSDAAMARDMRSRVEKLGLRTYTQVVDTGSGKRTRVRVGPFASREEADKAAARIRSAGIGQQQVLTL
jgi:DedD protein